MNIPDIYCEQCGNKLTPYSQKVGNDISTGEPKIKWRAKCRHKTLFILHETFYYVLRHNLSGTLSWEEDD